MATFSATETKLREQITQQQADHAVEIARITTEREKIEKEYSELAVAYKTLVKKHKFALEQLNALRKRLEKATKMTEFSKKARAIILNINNKAYLKIAKYNGEVDDEGRRLDDKGHKLQTEERQLDADEMTLSLRTMDVQDTSQALDGERNEDDEMPLA